MPDAPAAVPAVVIDHHVHLDLIDTAPLTRPLRDSHGHGLSRVVDLGAGPGGSHLGLAVPVDRAGQFLTAPGGYPSDRAWAPTGSVREVRDPADAARAVAEQVAAGAVVLKVTLHADAGPVLDLALVRAVVAAADPLPVVAHAEGAGMVELALEAGCAALAHTPWTEVLPDEVVAAAAASQAWISTLAIHDGTPGLEVACENLARFHRAGGRVLYGTDLGNGDLPVGVNHRELELLASAGLDEDAVARACADPWPRS